MEQELFPIIYNDDASGDEEVWEDEDYSPYRDLFLELVSDACEELGYPSCVEDADPTEIIAMELGLNNIAFSVVHSLNDAPERVLIECRFGKPPAERKGDTFGRLLQLNHEIGAEADTVFARDQATGDIMYCHAPSMDTMTGTSLVATMARMAKNAAHWRKTYFLDEEMQPQPAAQPDMSMRV